MSGGVLSGYPTSDTPPASQCITIEDTVRAVHSCNSWFAKYILPNPCIRKTMIFISDEDNLNVMNRHSKLYFQDVVTVNISN